ncbi:alpha/beta-hydrolase [Xylaria intraflava]|nr:alpha/beta-hydrolase [Xylaria intraflava]
MVTKPVILFSHGAWHSPNLYDEFKDALDARGYELLIPRHTIMGKGKTGVSWDSDVAALLRTVTPLFDQGREVIIMGHSYGGIPACIATRGNDVASRRAAGKRGGFRQLIFLTSFAMPRRGMSILSVTGGTWLWWHKVLELEGGGKQLFVNDHARDLLYNDYPPEKAQAVFDALEPCSYEAFVTGTEFSVPEVQIPKSYIICENDALVPPELQRELAYACGDELKKVSVSGGHSAFGSIPDELADVVVKLIKEEDSK